MLMILSYTHLWNQKKTISWSLNSDKTEVVFFGPKYFREKLSSYIVTLDSISLASSTPVRNIGVIFDKNLSFDARIKKVF